MIDYMKLVNEMMLNISKNCLTRTIDLNVALGKDLLDANLYLIKLMVKNDWF